MALASANTKRPKTGKQRRTARAPRSTDFATIFGLCVAFMLIGTAVWLGGSAGSFVDGPALLIVFGGTFSLTLTSFSFKDLGGAYQIVGQTLFRPRRDVIGAGRRILELAQAARKNGVLTLQRILQQGKDDPFLMKALGLVVDGMPADEIERLLHREILAMTERHSRSVELFRKAAEFAPAMGLIGTLVGLVQMLGQLNDPSAIGPAMAVALLTTFYGAVLATMVLSPLAAKLEQRSVDEALMLQFYLLGAASISRQENPRRLEMLLNAELPAHKRIQYFD